MFKKVLIGIVAVIVLLILVGFALPRVVHVERSITVKAPAEQIWSHIADFKAFNCWSPWFGIDPKTAYTFSGTPGEVGSKMVWKSEHPNVGNGTQEVAAVDKPKRLDTELDFGAQGKAKAAFSLAADGEATKVTWSLDSDMGAGPIGRWFGLMMDGMIGPDYEKGLAKLKLVAEKGPYAAAAKPAALPAGATPAAK